MKKDAKNALVVGAVAATITAGPIQVGHIYPINLKSAGPNTYQACQKIFGGAAIDDPNDCSDCADEIVLGAKG